MKPLFAFVRSALWWLLPLVALTALVAYETEFGRALRKAPPQLAPIEPKAVAVALLPEYAIPGGVAVRRETVERTLFTPTRRPAPTLVVEAAKPRMQRGQFALTGTLMVDGKNTAFLRETNGGRSRRVTQGETINGLVVAEVKPDRVKLAMGEEVEELVLRVTTRRSARRRGGCPCQHAGSRRDARRTSACRARSAGGGAATDIHTRRQPGARPAARLGGGQQRRGACRAPDTASARAHVVRNPRSELERRLPAISIPDALI